MSDQLSVLSLRVTSTSSSSFTSLERALGHPLEPTTCYDDIRTTCMARYTTIKPSSFLEPDDVTPLESVQLHELLAKFSLRHTSLAKALTNTTAPVRMSSTRKWTPLYNRSGTMIEHHPTCVTCADGRDTVGMCMSHDVRPAHQVSFVSDNSCWVQLFLCHCNGLPQRC